MNTTITETKAGVESDAKQELTSPVVTSTFTTPTLTFGEVGMTLDTTSPGYPARAHGVGHFESTDLLERSVLVGSFDWATSMTPGSLVAIDIENFLRHNTRIWDVLRQFRFYRSDIEVTVRLNSNQFYYGSLMVVMYPGDVTGTWLDEMAVLDPTIISASSAESLIKTWEYSFPHAWMKTADSNSQVRLVVWILNPLLAGSSTMPDHITVQVWARYKNIQVSYPALLPYWSEIEKKKKKNNKGPVEQRKSRFEAQSANGSLLVRKPKKRASLHPSGDPGAHDGANPAQTITSAVTSIASAAAEGLAELATDGVIDAIGALAFLDKPDRTDPQQAIIIEAGSDMLQADVPDTNVSVSLYKDRYVDPGKTRMPMTAAWTVSDYARIPGLRSIKIFSNNVGADTTTVDLIKFAHAPTDLRIPLDYAYLNAHMWRGSIKVLFQFFTSSFISARFIVQFINNSEFPSSYETDYTNGLAKVINVKGDTMCELTLPWLSRYWWSQRASPQIKISLDSAIATVDAVEDPKIYCNFWVAGGEDIQFMYPRIPAYWEWPNRNVLESPMYGKFPPVKRDFEPQANIQSMFKDKFPPIAEDCVYDIDNGFCSGEILGLITDVCKRYSIFPNTPNSDGTIFDGGCLDNFYFAPESGVQYGCWQAFRQTYFGSWRACFLYRSGGYRYRRFPNRDHWWAIESSTSIETRGTAYMPPYDETNRLTVPQIMPYPFGMLGVTNEQVSIGRKDTSSEMTFLAARDDLQFGYPILPTGTPDNYTPPEETAKAIVATFKKV